MATVQAAIQALQLLKKHPHASVNLGMSMSPLTLQTALFCMSSRSTKDLDYESPVEICFQLLASNSRKLFDRHATLDRNATFNPVRDCLGFRVSANRVSEVRHTAHRINGAHKRCGTAISFVMVGFGGRVFGNLARQLEVNAVEPFITACLGGRFSAPAKSTGFGYLHRAAALENIALDQVDPEARKLDGMLGDPAIGVFRSANLDASVREETYVKTVHLGHHPGFFGLAARRPARVWLNIVARRDGINAIAPDVGAKFSERESRVMSDNAFAEVWSRLARTARAEVQVVDVGSDRVGEQFPFGGLGRFEEGTEVHVATNQSECVANIDQKDLRIKRFALPLQIFLHVDQND